MTDGEGEDEPGEFVVARRLLRPVAAVMLLLWTAFAVRVAFWPTADFNIPATDWWYGALMGLLLSGLYLYVASRVVVSAEHVRVENPLRTVAIPVGHVIGVSEGSNLVIETSYSRFAASGVEAGSLAIATGVLPTQKRLSEVILRAAATGRGTDEPPARYRWVWPRPLVLILLPVIVVCFFIASR